MLDHLLRDERFRDLTDDPRFVVDLRYATAENFVGRNVYGAFNRALLHRDAAAALGRAAADLSHRRADHRFVIYDALRPRAMQRVLWDVVRGTPDELYVADPARGSLHNFGLAVDLAVVDGRGLALDVGAGFDDFREVAQPRLEAECLARGALSAAQLARRHLLRDVMHGAGFRQLDHEWWHFNYCSLDEAWAKYEIVE